MNERFAVVNTADLSEEVLAACEQNSVADCRKDTTGTKSVISWYGATPLSVGPISRTEYSASEILEEMKKQEWQTGDDAP